MSELVMKDVSLSHGRAKRWMKVLSHVSLDVRPGEVVGVVGARGSGKTTLLSVAAGLIAPQSGSVCLGDTDLTRLSARELAELRGERLAWVSRVGMSEKLEAAKLVGWPLVKRRGRKQAERDAIEMLRRVGAEGCAKLRWDELSPWEQVLVGLAQGFACEPEIIVIDDLLDGLGSPRTEEASDLIRSLMVEDGHRCGVLMSTTDRESAVLVDRVWSLEQGGRLIPTVGHSAHEAEIVPFRKRGQVN